MPYDKLEDLPESVRAHLPRHAQEIYRAAFNSAWDEYGHDEARAHRVA
jgi:cation transport regulator